VTCRDPGAGCATTEVFPTADARGLTFDLIEAVFEGLLSKFGAVHEEECAADALRFDESIDKGDGGAGLPAARGHGEHEFPLAGSDGLFHGVDCINLRDSQARKIDGSFRQRQIGGGDVCGERCLKSFRARRVGVIGGLAESWK